MLCNHSYFTLLSPSVSNPDELFIEFVERNAMQQLVTDITRPSPNNPRNGSCLDLVVSNDTFAISDLAITSNFSTSDHHSVSFKIATYIPSYNIPSSRYDLPNAVWSALNNHIFNIYWSSAFSNCQDVVAQFDLWNEKVTEALHLSVPIKTNCNIPGNYNRKYPVHIRKLLSKKRSAWGIYIKSLKPPQR